MNSRPERWASIAWIPFHPSRTPAPDTKASPLRLFLGSEYGEEKDPVSDEASEKRNREDGWMEVGAASIVAMRKQSNTNSGHSRGTAGAQRDSCLGGPGRRERGRECAGEISENKRFREDSKKRKR